LQFEACYINAYTFIYVISRAGYRPINPHLFRGARDPRGARPPPQKKRGKKKKKKKRGLDFSGVGGPAFSVSGPGHINMNRICFPAKQ